MSHCKHGSISTICSLCALENNDINYTYSTSDNATPIVDLEKESLKKENQELRDKIMILETQMSQIGAASVSSPRDHLTAKEFKEMFYNKPSGGLNFIEYRPDQEEYFLNFENAHSPVIVPHDTMLSPLMDRAAYKLRKKIEEPKEDNGGIASTLIGIAFWAFFIYSCTPIFRR